MTPKAAAPAKSRTLYLVDVSSFIFRAFFAIRSLTNRRGEPVNAVYGVASMLAKLVQDARAEYVGIVYDSKEPSFRKEIYPEYKANRSAAPEDLVPQFDKIENLVSCMGFQSYRMSGVEADDIIGTLAFDWRSQSKDHDVVIVTGDKDLMQLVGERIKIWDTMINKTYGPEDVKEKFGVDAMQIRDYLALVGDSSDNIPGVPSIGPKGAADLLAKFGDLDGILAAAAAGEIPGKKGEVLRNHVADARLSAELATLKMDVDVKADAEGLRYEFSVGSDCIALLKDLDFHTLLNKWAAHVGMSSEGGPRAPEPETEEAQPPEEESEKGPEPERSLENAGFSQAEFGFEAPASSPLSVQSTKSLPAPDFRMINTAAALDGLCLGIERAKVFAFDLETTSLNPREAEIVGFAICFDPVVAYYIPVGHRGTHVEQLPLEEVMGRLKPYLADPRYKKVGQNLKYDWSVLRCQGIEPAGIGADTMVAAYVLEPEGRHNMEVLATNHLGYSVTTYEQVCGKGKTQIGFDQVPVDQATRYSAEDAWVTWHLWDRLAPRLAAEGLMPIFTEVDLPLVDILSRMELQGVCIDEEYLAKLAKEFNTDLRRIEERITAFTKGPVNLNSPKQLAQLLFEELKLPVGAKTKTGYSTDASVLEGLAHLHEVPRLLLEYREISKLKGTYVDTLPTMRDRKTGKIHAGFHQAVAATGRLSSSDPNLQNIPIRTERGRKIRGAFIAAKGNCLLSADYSQIELRLLAHMSGDNELVRSFQAGEDVHRRTASEIFGVKPEVVDDRQRGIAKAINFGLMYGKTPFGLAQELKIPRKEAQDIINRYFERYNGVKRFLDNQILEAKEKGWTTTLLGRKRKLADISSRNPALRANAERMAMNSPIQGTAADLVKLAMIHLDEALARGKYRSRLIIQVHDELLLECPTEEVKEVEKLLVSTMENAMKLSVPLSVNSAVGDNWLEL